jgi:hypothetical protein
VAFAADAAGSAPPQEQPEPVEGGNSPVESGGTPDRVAPLAPGPTGGVSPAGGRLPFTGLDPRPAASAGVAAIVAGAGLLKIGQLFPDPDDIPPPPA